MKILAILRDRSILLCYYVKVKNFKINKEILPSAEKF